MIAKVTFLLGFAVALATAALRSESSRPLLFGTNRIIPRIPVTATESNGTATVWGTFNQRQAYTNAQNQVFFPMRFVSNGQHYRRGGPIFLFVGGPWTLREEYVERGHFVDMAAELNGFLVANELRYYGESIPTEDATTSNFRYFHNVQILFDLATFIDHLRNEVVGDPEAKVILAGVGYSATLAQWMRQRFPHLVHAVWSSSGTSESSVSYGEYAEEMGRTIRRYGGDECYNVIWRAFRTAENLIDAGFSGTVSQMFNVCRPIDGGNPVDVEAFFYGIFNEISTEAVAFNLRQNIMNMCRNFTESEQSSLFVLADWLTRRFLDAECLAMDFESIVEAYGVTNWDDEMLRNGERQWLFQRCTEFGWPLTTDSPHQPFGNRFSTNLFQQACERVFASWLTRETFEELISQTNDYYGGARPDIRYAIFTHGSLDPWRFTGVNRVIFNNTFVNMIRGAFHGEDLASISAADTSEMRESKQQVSDAIRRWLSTR